jgi:hypothetical protein
MPTQSKFDKRDSLKVGGKSVRSDSFHRQKMQRLAGALRVISPPAYQSLPVNKNEFTCEWRTSFRAAPRGEGGVSCC